jgi:hypothetical protein
MSAICPAHHIHLDFMILIISLRGPLSLVSTIEEKLGKKKKGRGSGLESREYDRRDPSRWLRGTLYPRKLTLTLPTSGGRPVGIVRSRTQATEFSCYTTLSLLSRSSFYSVSLYFLEHFPQNMRPHITTLWNSSQKSCPITRPYSLHLRWSEIVHVLN